MRKLTADIVYPVSGPPLPEGVVILHDDGTIVALDTRQGHDPDTLEYHAGALVPGFVNAHCHLELSHLKGKVDTGTGLLPFLKSVVSFREVEQDIIDQAIEAADAEMQREGIVAVGDISNKADTARVKAASPIRYHTFVEMFDFMQDAWAEKTFRDYMAVFEAQADGNGNRKSVVPHAPYTVSEKLFALLRQAQTPPCTVSIHNQETWHEDAFFLRGEGGFPDFFRDFGIDMSGFRPTGRTSIHYALAHMNPECRTLFVHNTLTTPPDIEAAHAWGERNVFWVTCPNANLYIENRLPHYRYFLEADAQVCIGTDSLTSNWQLSVLEEMKTIARYQSYVPFGKMLEWATRNGARALGFEDELGTLEPGKRPGINLITGMCDGKLTPESRVQKLA